MHGLHLSPACTGDNPFVSGGLFGAIMVDDPEPIEVSPGRILVVSDIGLNVAGKLSPRIADGTARSA